MEMIFRQKQLREIEISSIKDKQQVTSTMKVTKTITLVTAALNIHLNIGQNLTRNTSALFISLETTSLQSLTNKIIQPFNNAQIRIPTHFQSNSTTNTTISLQVRCFCFINNTSLVFLL